MEQIRLRFGAWWSEVEALLAGFHSGRALRLDLEPVDDSYGDITDGGALDRVRREVEGASSEATRDGYRRLVVGLELAVLERRTRRLRQELWRRCASQKAVIDDRERTLFEWRRGVATVADGDQRRRIAAAIEGAERDLEELAAELFVEAGRAALGLGFESAADRFQAHHPGVDLATLGGLADGILAATESVYFDRLRTGLEAIRVDPKRALAVDLERVLSLPLYAELFPRDKAVEALEHTVERMDLRLARLPIGFDVAPRPHKSPLPWVHGFGDPLRIVVLTPGRRGVGGTLELFEAAGRALARVYASPTLPVEKRRVVDPALDLLWGLVLRDRIGDPSWIEFGPPARAAVPFAADMRFWRVAELRRVAARTRWEVKLAATKSGAAAGDLPAMYAEELSAAMGVHVRSHGVLVDAHDLTACHRLRALVAAPMLAEFLRQEFGERFEVSAGCGSLLKELWNTGGTYSPEAVLGELGVGPLQLEPLLKAVG